MELFFILFLILVIVGTIAWAVSVWTGPRPRRWQGEILLGGLTLSVAGFTFLIAMSNPVERSFWMIP